MAYNINFSNGSGQIELFNAHGQQIDARGYQPDENRIRILKERARAIVQACQSHFNSFNSRIVVDIDLQNGWVHIINGGMQENASRVPAFLMQDEQAQIKNYEDQHWPDAPTVFDLGKSMLDVFRVAHAEGNDPVSLAGSFTGHPHVPQESFSHQQHPLRGQHHGQSHGPGMSPHHQPTGPHRRGSGAGVSPTGSNSRRPGADVSQQHQTGSSSRISPSRTSQRQHRSLSRRSSNPSLRNRFENIWRGRARFKEAVMQRKKVEGLAALYSRLNPQSKS